VKVTISILDIAWFSRVFGDRLHGARSTGEKVPLRVLEFGRLPRCSVEKIRGSVGTVAEEI
jgi:hypothetical protein